MQPWSLLSRLIADAKRERVAFVEVLITLSVINEPHSYMLDDTGHDLKSNNSSSALSGERSHTPNRYFVANRRKR